MVIHDTEYPYRDQVSLNNTYSLRRFLYDYVTSSLLVPDTSCQHCTICVMLEDIYLYKKLKEVVFLPLFV